MRTPREFEIEMRLGGQTGRLVVADSRRWSGPQSTSARAGRFKIELTSLLQRYFGADFAANHLVRNPPARPIDGLQEGPAGSHEAMTVAQSERLFREEAFQNPGGARQQAVRGTYDPAYLNYTLGKLAIKKLRDDWVAKQVARKPDADPKSYWHDFHDQFLLMAATDSAGAAREVG